jgi:hypothetical protein
MTRRILKPHFFSHACPKHDGSFVVALNQKQYQRLVPLTQDQPITSANHER